MRICIVFLLPLLLASCMLLPQETPPAPLPSQTPAKLQPSATKQALPPTWTPTASPTVTLTPTFTQTPTAAPSPTPLKPSATPDPSVLNPVDIRMYDAKNGWALDQSGRLLRTDSGPQAWQNASPWPDSPGQKTVFFRDLRTVMAAVFEPGSDTSFKIILWRTSDGGASWKTAETTLNDGEVYHSAPTQLIFTDELHGLMYFQIYPGMFHCETAIYATQDGGGTWKKIESSFAMQSFGNSGYLKGAYSLPYGPRVLAFRNQWVGFASNGALLATFDGGATWQEQTLPQAGGSQQYTHYYSPPWFTSPADGVLIDNAYDYADIYCPPCDDFSALPKQTSLIITHDGGKTWQRSPAPALGGTLNFLNANTGWYLGATGAGHTGLFRTQDGGKTWIAITENSPLPLGTTLAFTNQNFGLAYNFYGTANKLNQYDYDPRSTSDAYLFITNDGGVTWEKFLPRLK